jgi:hypothetical protein
MFKHPRHTFGPLAHINHPDQIKPVHAVVLDAYRRDHGLPPWLKRERLEPMWPTVSEINAAVDWYNEWEDHG